MEIDIHGEVSDSTGRPSPSFSGALYWILAVCRATGLLWRKTLKTRKDLFQHLDKLHKWITSRGKVLKVIRSDNEFVIAVVTDWLHDKRGIRILPSIPFAQLSEQIRPWTTLSQRCWICLATLIYLDSIGRWHSHTH